MIKYFVSYAYIENGNQEFGWTTIEMDHYLTSEQDLMEVTQVLQRTVGIESPIILYFTAMANGGLTTKRHEGSYGSN